MEKVSRLRSIKVERLAHRGALRPDLRLSETGRREVIPPAPETEPGTDYSGQVVPGQSFRFGTKRHVVNSLTFSTTEGPRLITVHTLLAGSSWFDPAPGSPPIRAPHQRTSNRNLPTPCPVPIIQASPRNMFWRQEFCPNSKSGYAGVTP
jgi:hypothetical protein